MLFYVTKDPLLIQLNKRRYGERVPYSSTLPERKSGRVEEWKCDPCGGETRTPAESTESLQLNKDPSGEHFAEIKK